MWVIDDKKISAIAKTFMNETEINNAYVMQKSDSTDWIQLFDNSNPEASVILKVSKLLFKHVREYSPTEWNPYPEVKPTKDGQYLVTRLMKTDSGEFHRFMQIAAYEYGRFYMKNDVIAFRELPDPYYERNPWDNDDSESEEGD